VEYVLSERDIDILINEWAASDGRRNNGGEPFNLSFKVQVFNGEHRSIYTVDTYQREWKRIVDTIRHDTVVPFYTWFHEIDGLFDEDID